MRSAISLLSRTCSSLACSSPLACPLFLLFLWCLLPTEAQAQSESVESLESVSANHAAAAHSPAEVCGMARFQLSMVPIKDAQEQLQEVEPLVALLADELGIPVQMLPASSYESVVDAMTSGVADMAMMGPAAYIMANHREPGLEPFVSLITEGGAFTPEGSYYYSALLVSADSDFREPQDLRGARVALSDPASTSGNLIPRASFPAVSGDEFNAFFASRIYAGGHDRALDALLAGRVDSAFVASTRVDEYVRRGIVAASELRVIWRSEPLHYDPLVFSARLCEPLKARIRELMLTPSPRLSRYLANVGAKGITPVSHENYAILAPFVLSQ